MQHEFKRAISSLEPLFQFAEEFFAREQIDREHLGTIHLVLEELFTNMVKYNPENEHKIVVSLEREKNRLRLCLTDFAAQPFDITRTGTVDIHQPLEERRVGGLGIHLVKQMMDSIKYEYGNGQSRITLIKELD